MAHRLIVATRRRTHGTKRHTGHELLVIVVGSAVMLDSWVIYWIMVDISCIILVAHHMGNWLRFPSASQPSVLLADLWIRPTSFLHVLLIIEIFIHFYGK